MSFLPLALAISTDDQLNNLEEKFFAHSYSKETLSARLDRLEKMIYGESKQGSDQERINNLVQTVPEANTPPKAKPPSDVTKSTDQESDKTTANSEPAPTPTKAAHNKHLAPETPASDNVASDEDKGPLPGESKYPAVTAIEQKLLGRDYAQEPVETRLARLETKLFGKPQTAMDLSDRVDRLKQSSGVDITQQPPRGSDWSDEDDIDEPGMRSAPVSQAPSTGQGNAGSDADAMSFSGRNMREDFQKAFGNRNGGSSSFGTDSMASAAGVGEITPFTPPPAPQSRPRNQYSAPTSGLGLSQQTSALETEIFGKTYTHDALSVRLTRLETAVFPKEKPSVDKPLPDRVSRLLAAVPLSSETSRKHIAQHAQSADDDNDTSNLPAVAPQHQSGLGKVIGKLGNFLSGGMSGGYPVQGGSLMTDPRTGMLYDPSTGNLIDPNSGVVVGHRSVPGYTGSPYMGSPMGGMSSFGSGFAPFGSPYGTGFGGVNFGIGGGRFGGMWP
jgi:hypothetical protein